MFCTSWQILKNDSIMHRAKTLFTHRNLESTLITDQQNLILAQWYLCGNFKKFLKENHKIFIVKVLDWYTRDKVSIKRRFNWKLSMWVVYHFIISFSVCVKYNYDMKITCLFLTANQFVMGRFVWVFKIEIIILPYFDCVNKWKIENILITWQFI